MTDFEKMTKLVNELDADDSYEQIQIMPSISIVPTEALFRQQPVEWNQIYFCKDNILNSVLVSGTLADFQTFSLCWLKHLNDVDVIRVLNQIGRLDEAHLPFKA